MDRKAPQAGAALPPASSARPATGTAPVIVLSAILAAFLAGRVIQVLGGEVFVAFDSAVYRFDPARNFGPLVSPTGHAPRPWGLPAFYAMFADDQARAVGQWALATAAWVLLAWELSRHVRILVAQAVAVAAIFGLALTNTVASWDFAILTESTSISIGLIVVATLLHWARTGSWISLAVMTVAAVWWTFIRPDIRVFTVVLIAVLLGVAWRAWRRRQAPAAPGAPGWRGRVRAAAIASVVLALGIGWYSAITPTMMKTFQPYDGDALPGNPLGADEKLFVYRLRVDVSTDPVLWNTFKTKLGMPTCAETESFTRQAKWQAREWTATYTRCPELRAWVTEHLDSGFWLTLARAAPDQAARKFFENSSRSLGGDIYARTPYVIPGAIQRLAFPSVQQGLVVALIGLGVALALALVSGARRRHPLLLAAGLILGGTALLSVLATVYVHSGEYRRFGIQETVAIRIAVVILVVCAIDSWLSRRAPAGVPQGTDAEPAAKRADQPDPPTDSPLTTDAGTSP